MSVERAALDAVLAEARAGIRATGIRAWTERHVIEPGVVNHEVRTRVQDVIVPAIVVRHPPGCGCAEVQGARPAPPPPPRTPWRHP